MTRGHRWFFLGSVLALAAGWGAFPLALYRSEQQPLQFSHRTHTGESLGLECAYCHGFQDDGRFTGIPETARCIECHASMLGQTEEERLLVTEYTEPGRAIPWRIYARQPDNVWFPHAAHVLRAELPCSSCHGDHGESETLQPLETNRISGYSRNVWGPRIGGSFWGPPQGMKMDRCITCHEQQGRHDGCIACHR
jgi:hypothetical protein